MTITIDRDEAVRSLEAHHSMLTRLSGVADLTPAYVTAVRANLEAENAAARKETEHAQLQAGEAKIELAKARKRAEELERELSDARTAAAAAPAPAENTLEDSRTRSRDRMLATALRKDAAQARTHLTKAVTLFEDDDFDKAMRQLQLALDILPERGEAQ